MTRKERTKRNQCEQKAQAYHKKHVHPALKKPEVATPEILARLAAGRYMAEWRDTYQVGGDGREWADVEGPASDRCVLLTRIAVDALRALEAVMDDAGMGGFRYGKITAGQGTIAEVTRSGRIFAVKNIRHVNLGPGYGHDEEHEKAIKAVLGDRDHGYICDL